MVLRKGFLFVLLLGVFGATSAGSLAACCTLQQLSGPTSTEVRNCCDRADCCRVEKLGTPQATLAVKTPEVAATVALAAGQPQWLPQNAFASPAALARRPPLERDHPPPRGGRDTHLRISLLRI